MFEDDSFVYTKLEQSEDKPILEKLKMLNPNIKIKEDPNDFDFHSRNKLRYIDPKFTDLNNSIKRLSQEFNDFADKLKEHQEKIKKGHFIKVVSY